MFNCKYCEYNSIRKYNVDRHCIKKHPLEHNENKNSQYFTDEDINKNNQEVNSEENENKIIQENKKSEKKLFCSVCYKGYICTKSLMI